jgi:hypothetical protein
MCIAFEDKTYFDNPPPILLHEYSQHLEGHLLTGIRANVHVCESTACNRIFALLLHTLQNEACG